MTLLFLLALAWLGFTMKLIWMLTFRAESDRMFVWSPLISPHCLQRARSSMGFNRLLARTVLLLGAVTLAYTGYWTFVRHIPTQGFVLSYCAAPILLLVSNLAVCLLRLLLWPTGQRVQPLHKNPFAARGVAEFWGHRWNLWFSDWFRHVIFQPLRHRPIFALLTVFAVSGLMHEAVVNLPLWCLTGRWRFGSMMLYFLTQAAGWWCEHRFLKEKPRARWGFAWLVVFAPLPLVINEGLLRTLLLWP